MGGSKKERVLRYYPAAVCREIMYKGVNLYEVRLTPGARREALAVTPFAAWEFAARSVEGWK